MILISHRGNISGRNIDFENSPDYIEDATRLGYDVEVDLWFYKDQLHLGHDEPQYKISLEWLYQKNSKLWIHCKNVDSLVHIYEKPLHYFWHEEDTLTLTSKGYMWVYPGKQPIKNSIAVMPELFSDDVSKCVGVCSDYIESYRI